MPVTVSNTHESVYRSYQVLGEVTGMLDRGDSPETIRKFIAWAYVSEPHGRFAQEEL